MLTKPVTQFKWNYLKYFKDKGILWTVVRKSFWNILHFSMLGQNLLTSFFPNSRSWMMFLWELEFSSIKSSFFVGVTWTRIRSTISSLSSLGCLFCIMFKQTYNDKPLCSSLSLSLSLWVSVSHFSLCSSDLTTYNYVVGATGMEPCRRKKCHRKA